MLIKDFVRTEENFLSLLCQDVRKMLNTWGLSSFNYTSLVPTKGLLLLLLHSDPGSVEILKCLING